MYIFGKKKKKYNFVIYWLMLLFVVKLCLGYTVYIGKNVQIL